MDGFGARRSDNPPDTAHADRSGSQARATANILGSRQELCPLPGNRQPWHDQHADSSQPGMAPTVRGRHGDNDIASHSMGSSTTRMASQTHQNRAGHPSPPNSGNGQLDFADSAPVGVHRVECGAEEGPAFKQGQPLPRTDQASRSQPAQEHGKGRKVHRLQSLKPLRPDLQADVVVMLLTLTIHQHAAEVYRDLDLLANNCAGKVIGLRLRKERVNKTSLAKELEKLQL